MQSYKTNQVGGRASQGRGIACIIKVNVRMYVYIYIYIYKLLLTCLAHGKWNILLQCLGFRFNSKCKASWSQIGGLQHSSPIITLSLPFSITTPIKLLTTKWMWHASLIKHMKKVAKTKIIRFNL